MTAASSDSRTRSPDPAVEEALRTGPFHTALQLAIADSGLTLERLEYRLRQRQHHVGRSTLSYWQQGRRRPERPASLRALAALEEVLGLPESSLSSLLGPRKPRGRWIGYQGQGLDWGDVWATSDDVRRLTAIDTRRAAERSQEVAISELLVVGADQRLQSLELQVLIRARQANADRTLMVFNADPDTDVSKIEVTDMEGCRTGRRRALTDARLLAFEVLYDRSLAEGDTHFTKFTLDFTGAYLPGVEPVPALEGGRAFRRSVPSYIMRVRFDSSALPARCFHTRSPRTGPTQQHIDDLVVSAQGTTHIAEQNVQPGVHRVQWEWE